MNRILLIANLILTGALIAIVTLIYTGNNTTIAYIDVNSVYDNFDYKIEMEDEYDKLRAEYRSRLDSLSRNIEEYNTIIDSIGPETISESHPIVVSLLHDRRLFEDLRSSYDQELASIKEDYIQEIWGQLNLYIGEYGERNKLSIILGAEGSGSLMYADKSFDVTEEVLEYANKRFNGTLGS